MHDALTVSEYPAIPTWFQARVVTQSGKIIIQQKSSNADVQKVQFDVGSRILGKSLSISRGRLPDFNRHPVKPVPNIWSRSDPIRYPCAQDVTE